MVCAVTPEGWERVAHKCLKLLRAQGSNNTCINTKTINWQAKGALSGEVGWKTLYYRECPYLVVGINIY